MSWSLRFASADGAPHDVIAQLLTAQFGTVSVSTDDWSGNPRDGYARGWTLRAGGREPGLAAVVTFVEHAQSQDSEGPPNTTSLAVELCADALAVHARLAQWHALAAAFAVLGYRDRSLLACPRQIALELDAAGLAAEAAKLRADVTLALLEAVTRDRSVTLARTCPDDLDRVLRAWVQPGEIVSVSFSRCGLTALPAALACFPNARFLYLDEPALDAFALDGWSFPRLEMLSLTGSGATRLTAEALRGLPAVQTIFLADTPLESVDPGVRVACPGLERLHLRATPLARDTARVAALERALPGVRIER